MSELNMLLLDKRTQARVLEYMPRYEQIYDLSRLFYVFCDPTRLKIITALSMTSLCVTDLARLLNTNQTTLSHQLKTLRDAKLIKSTRQGKIIFYSLSKKEVCSLLYLGVEALGY